MPKRVQLRRTKGWRMPPNTVVVDRRTNWGNPFKAASYGSGIHANEMAVKLFECWLNEPSQQRLKLGILRDLRGKNLACWCNPNHPCHADVLLEIANR